MEFTVCFPHSRGEGGVVCGHSYIKWGLDNRKEVGEEGLVKVVMPLHGAGIGSLTYEMVVRDVAVSYSLIRR